jgi:hypothetical protein
MTKKVFNTNNTIPHSVRLVDPLYTPQSDPMGTDKQTNGRTNRQTNGQIFTQYSGISSHSLRGVRIQYK